jgi:hypothetical protein
VPVDVHDSDEFRGARFTHADLSEVKMHDVDLSGARITDAMLLDAELSGMIATLKVNGVYVAPLVEAELDRLHPERVAMRATTPAGLREGWAAVEAMWQPTIELAQRLPESTLHERVEGEWSLVETLRHLIFVTDGWFGRTVLGESEPYHPLGLVPTFLAADAAKLGLDATAAPSFAEVLDVRAGRTANVRDYLATVDAYTLSEPRRRNDSDGYPPPTEDTVLSCLHVVMDEEWWHHQYAARDLARLTMS